MTIVSETENRTVLMRVEDPLNAVVRVAAKTSTRLARYIDPYGDTIFNSLQFDDLRADFRDMQVNADEGERQVLQAVASALDAAAAEAHLYVRFIGD